MAIIKLFSTPYGVGGEYCKISVANIDWYNKECHFEVHVFLSKNSRMNGAAPLLKKKHYIPRETFDNIILSGNLLENLYGHIKSLAEYEGYLDEV